MFSSRCKDDCTIGVGADIIMGRRVPVSSHKLALALSIGGMTETVLVFESTHAASGALSADRKCSHVYSHGLGEPMRRVA